MAYKQNAGRDDLTNLNISALTNGGTNPETDPEPNGVVASNSDKTFGSGVTNELDTVTLNSVKNTKPVVTGPSNRAESIERQKQIKAGSGTMLDKSYDYDNAVINKTTSTVNKVNNEGEPYSMTRNTFSNASGGQPVNVDNTSSQVFIGPRDKGTFFSSADDQQQVQNSRNYMNSDYSSTRRGSEMQNFGTFVTGGRDSGEPVRKYMQNMQSGSIAGQISGPGTARYVGQTTHTLPNARTNEFVQDPHGYTPTLDGRSRKSSSILNMKPQEAMNYIKQDSLSAQDSRFSRGIFKAAVKSRNSMFTKDITSGKDN